MLLDCGLTAEQRELLEPEVDARRPRRATRPPWLLKTIAPLARPAEVTVLVDTDMVATRPLTELIERAARGPGGRVPRPPGPLLRRVGRAARPRPRRAPRPTSPRGSSRSAATSASRCCGLLDSSQRRGRLRAHLLAPKRRATTRFLYADQDVLNAILATTRRPATRIVALDNRLAPNPPYRGLRVADEARLRCAYRDGTEPFVVHQYVRKPWLEATYDGVYSRLLRRLLTGDDVAIRVPEDEVPTAAARRRPGPRRARARQRPRLPAVALRRPPPGGDRGPHRGPAAKARARR